MRSRSLLITAGAAAGLVAAAAPALGHDAAPPARAAATTATVRFGEYFYRPRKVTIRAGDRVRFVNVGKIEHTVADATKGGTIRSRIIRPRPLARGSSQTVTFKRRGTVYYLCTFHPNLMRGVVTVR
jgi:plastocyanin